eukprot:gene4992-6216_t
MTILSDSPSKSVSIVKSATTNSEDKTMESSTNNNSEESTATTTTTTTTPKNDGFIPLSIRLQMQKQQSTQNQNQKSRYTQNNNNYQNNITFFCQNFLYDTKFDVNNSYEVILGLSISKWIHLNWGDEGIKKFFFKVHRLLKDDGIFIFEPQHFKGYSKRKFLTPAIKDNFLNIKLTPEQFPQFLIDQVKFKSFELLYDPSQRKGFDRCIYKFIK